MYLAQEIPELYMPRACCMSCHGEFYRNNLVNHYSSCIKGGPKDQRYARIRRAYTQDRADAKFEIGDSVKTSTRARFKLRLKRFEATVVGFSEEFPHCVLLKQPGCGTIMEHSLIYWEKIDAANISSDVRLRG